MPRTRTLLQLRTEVRETADFENVSAITDAILTRQINQSIADLHDKLIDADGPTYMRASSVIATVADTATIDLPATFYKLYGVDVQTDGSGEYRDAYPLDWARRNDFEGSPGWSMSPVYFSLEPGTAEPPFRSLRLFPTPTAVHNVRVWYVPYATELSGDSDTFDGINGWERYVVLDVAIWLRNRQEESVKELVLERQLMEARLTKMATRTDRTGPRRPRDVRRRRLPVEERWRWSDR